MTESDKIKAFWHWFVHNQSTIARAFLSSDDDWLRSEMTPRVLKILPDDHVGPRINWQIGPGSGTRWQFCLSPLVKKNLPLTRRIALASPHLPDWEILPCKPPRNSIQYDLVSDDGARHVVPFDKMKYALTQYPGEKFSFDLIGEIPYGVDVANKKKAAYLIIEGILGEEFVLDHVVDVDLHDLDEFSSEVPTTPLADVKRHLCQLLQG